MFGQNLQQPDRGGWHGLTTGGGKISTKTPNPGYMKILPVRPCWSQRNPSSTRLRKFKTRRVMPSDGCARELTFSCYHMLPLLDNDRARRYMAGALNKARGRFPVHVWAWVFMPNHVHLLLWPLEENFKVSEYRKYIKQSVSRKYLQYCRECQPGQLKQPKSGNATQAYHFWQSGGGYDRSIRQVSTLRNVVNYIHNNPVRKGLAENPEDWEWSSFRDWMGLGTGHVNIDREWFPMLEE